MKVYRICKSSLTAFIYQVLLIVDHTYVRWQSLPEQSVVMKGFRRAYVSIGISVPTFPDRTLHPQYVSWWLFSETVISFFTAKGKST